VVFNKKRGEKMRLDGKVAVITGGASGIGEACAYAFTEVGGKVVIADRNEKRAQMVLAGLRERGREAEFIKLEVTDEASVKAMVDFAEERFGGLDCAVNCAGYANPRQPFVEIPTQKWVEIWQVCTMGVISSMRHEIPALLRRGGGAIVNIASDAGRFGIPQMGPYVTAKHGVVGVTRSAAAEFGCNNIRINAVCPGLIATPLAEAAPVDWSTVAPNPMGRVGKPHEIADAALWLVSSRSSFVSGQAISVNGGRFSP
jgi:NAD(P)-dependent dehydrogenase (short-subunit alcohol dehydrogenase family)